MVVFFGMAHHISDEDNFCKLTLTFTDEDLRSNGVNYIDELSGETFTLSDFNWEPWAPEKVVVRLPDQEN